MKNSARIMFFFGILSFGIVTLIVHQGHFVEGDFALWVFLVLIALSATISISIPGMLEIHYSKNNDGGMQLLTDNNNNPNPTNLAEKEPLITASGAIAVFLLVYLFNPM